MREMELNAVVTDPADDAHIVGVAKSYLIDLSYDTAAAENVSAFRLEGVVCVQRCAKYVDIYI